MEPSPDISLNKRKKKGLLVSFEGIDFCGKSVQIELLLQALERRTIPAVVFREPGATEISEKIRDILLDNKNNRMGARTEVLLYAAARAQLVAEKIIPAIQAGKVVILDRFFDSTTAYQGYGREIDLDFIIKLNTFATCALKPDITFLIDLDPEIALKRKDAKEYDRLEREDISFHKRVREGFLKIANLESECSRFVVIDGRKTINTINSTIFKQIEKYLI